MFQKVIQLLPDHFSGYSSLAGVYLEMGRYDEAISLLKKSIEIRPTASDAHWNLGYANFMLRRFPESAAEYEEAAKLREPQHYSIWGNLGDAYYWSPSQQHREKARAAYERAVALAKDELKVNQRSADARIDPLRPSKTRVSPSST